MFDERTPESNAPATPHPLSAEPLPRRTVLRGAAAGAALFGGGLVLPSAAQEGAAKPAPQALPALPYAVDALEPVIGTRIMELHHGKHHAAYVKGINAALDKYPKLAAQDLQDVLRNLARVPEDIRTAVRNHGGGHVNHSMFWEIMGPNAGGEPNGELGAAITSTFGDFARFKEAFNKAGGGQFGSGWVWLTLDKDGKLAVEATPNQDTPLSLGREVVMGNDVWEHAYYLTYENRRGEYLAAWWNVVNWRAVAARYNAAKARASR
ncbi:MAG: superoxide dismutase [Planctomycetota bacterium]